MEINYQKVKKNKTEFVVLVSHCKLSNLDTHGLDIE